MNSLTLYLPIPGKELRPNARFATRGGMIVKARAVRAARRRAFVEAKRVLAGRPAPVWRRAKYRATLCTVRASRLDPDNFAASLKAYLDGIADAGIVENDRGLWPERPVFRRGEKMPHVEIVIERE